MNGQGWLNILHGGEKFEPEEREGVVPQRLKRGSWTDPHLFVCQH